MILGKLRSARRRATILSSPRWKPGRGALLAPRPAQILLIGLLGSLACGSLAAQIEIPPGKWWKNDPALMRELNLTPPQVERIESIFERYRDRLVDIQAEVRKKSLGLQDLLEGDSVDEPRIESQIVALENARAELAKQRMMMIVKIRGQLTSDQWRLLRRRYAQRPPDAPIRPRRLRPGAMPQPPRY